MEKVSIPTSGLDEETEVQRGQVTQDAFSE